MVRVCAFAVLLIVAVRAASAQPANPPKPAAQENVTVTATKSRAVVETFTKAMATPTKLTGKNRALGEWHMPALRWGRQPALTAMVTQRVKDVAVTAGAPVSSLESCTPNIEVIFTTTPQALLDDISKHDPDYLGYAENSSEKEKLSTVTRPIQAWYATHTMDSYGRRTTDSARQVGTGITMPNFAAHSLPTSMAVNHDPIYLPNASFARVTGNHITDGARSAFNHVIIVDFSKLAGQKIGPLVDYIAMLSLTQLNALDTCQQLPSIVMSAAELRSEVRGPDEYRRRLSAWPLQDGCRQSPDLAAERHRRSDDGRARQPFRAPARDGASGRAGPDGLRGTGPARNG